MSYTNPKNKLQNAILDLIRINYHNHLYQLPDANEFFRILGLEIKELNLKYPKCKRIEVEMMNERYEYDKYIVYIGDFAKVRVIGINTSNIHSMTFNNVASMSAQINHLIEENKVLMNRVLELQKDS